MQDVVAVLAHAVYVIAHRGKLAGLERTLLRFEYLLEAILRQLIVLQMVRLMLVCRVGQADAVDLKWNIRSAGSLTHVGLVLEGVIAALATTMIVRYLLAVEGAILNATILVGAKTPETLVHNLRVLAMEVGVHLHIAGAHIDLGTVLVDAVIVGLLPIVGTAIAIGGRTVIRGGEPCEAQFEALLALLVPL